MYVRDEKVTTDVSADVLHCLGEVEAQAFYTTLKTKRGRGSDRPTRGLIKWTGGNWV